MQEEVMEEYIPEYEDERGFDVEEDPILPVPPPGAHLYRSPVMKSPVAHVDDYAGRPELLVDVEVPAPRERGHVRSPVLAR